MASEILCVPEEHLRDVIKVIRSGLAFLSLTECPIDREAKRALMDWCRDKEEYLNALSEDSG